MRVLIARISAVAGAILLVGVVGYVAKAWWDSRLPDTYSVMDHGRVDHGGLGSAHPSHGATSVSDLRGPEGSPDSRFLLTARKATIRLRRGRAVEALTFDGRSPGPELRVRQGDLVAVTLVNEDVAQGVTIHWHGVDVPNAEDGVAGVTQDAVLPGRRHVYRFRAEQVGTFWYHTHQVSSKEVRRGLFGALVIEPAAGSPPGFDLPILAHTFDGIPTLNADDLIGRQRIAAGTRVRLRLINTDGREHHFTLGGVPFRVVAIDGTDLAGPTPLEGTALELAGGGRMDVAFTMPAGPVQLSLDGTSARIVMSPHGAPPATPPLPGPELDLLRYGEAAPTPFDRTSDYDRRFELTVTRKPAFLDGRPGLQWAINGGVFPEVPVFMVEEGDLVHVSIANETDAVHPVHLHGHHVLVLSRDGVTASGSPWWSDTLNVAAGERYEVAFRADNPGIWMDHCHNLRHAADGLTMHVMYAGVTTPYEIGGEARNQPE